MHAAASYKSKHHTKTQTTTMEISTIATIMRALRKWSTIELSPFFSSNYKIRRIVVFDILLGVKFYL